MFRLILTGSHWRDIARAVTGGDERWLVGPTGSRRSGDVNDVLVRTLEGTEPGRVERALGRWSDIIVVLPSRAVDPQEAERTLADLGLARARRASVIVVGTGERAGRVHGIVCESGRTERFYECRVIGAGGPVWRSGASSGSVSKDESQDGVPERFSRVAGAMSPRVWRRLRELSVAIVGCGRSGSVAAELLAREGVGTLHLIDPDVVEEGNLDAMLCAGPDDLGRPKAHVVADSLRRMRPELSLLPLVESGYGPESLRRLRTVDAIITTVDRDAARLAIAHLASAYLKVHLDVGTAVMRGSNGRERGADVRLLVPGSGCILCVGGLGDEEAARRELARGGDAPRDETNRPRWSDERAGSLATLNFAAVSLGIQLLFDYVAGAVRGSRWIRFDWDEAVHEVRADVDGSSSPECPVCQALGLGDYRFGAG